MLRKSIFSCLLFLPLLFTTAFAQDVLLQSGPMVGYSTMREVVVWVQTKAPAKVQILYWEKGNPNPQHYSDPVQTEKSSAYTAHILADKVQPGKTYKYTLLINGKKVSRPYELEFKSQSLWQHRTDPPTVKFAVGSCAFMNDEPYDRPGNPYGGQPEIFTSIHAKKPEMMVWLGDNVYLREADWNSRTGIQYRYTHDRALSELQPLLGSTHHYATWDDHDFGPNDSDRGYQMKETTLETFKDFWANPGYGIDGDPGVYGSFQWADLQFFMLDNRYHRTPNDCKTCNCTWLGETQYQWLIDGLKTSKAPFKFVCIGGQVISGEAKFETYINQCPEERKKLIDKIVAEKIDGVIFMDGDRHHTELSKYQPTGFYPLYDLTVSPLTSGAYDGDPTVNKYYVDGTYVGKRNFGLLEVTGPEKDRKLKIGIYDVNGAEIWNREIAAKELKAK